MQDKKTKLTAKQKENLIGAKFMGVLKAGKKAVVNEVEKTVTD